MDNNKYKHAIRLLCKCLNIHLLVYYYLINHKNNSYTKSNELLDKQIKKIYDKSKGRYGSLKITKILTNEGVKVSH